MYCGDQHKNFTSNVEYFIIKRAGMRDEMQINGTVNVKGQVIMGSKMQKVTEKKIIKVIENRLKNMCRCWYAIASVLGNSTERRQLPHSSTSRFNNHKFNDCPNQTLPKLRCWVSDVINDKFASIVERTSILSISFLLFPSHILFEPNNNK